MNRHSSDGDGNDALRRIGHPPVPRRLAVVVALLLATLLPAVGTRAAAAGGTGAGTTAFQERDRWWQQHGLEKGSDPAFSFVYGGCPSRELLDRWPVRGHRTTPGAGRTGVTRKWRDPATGLTVRCEAVRYTHYPVLEWIVYLRNDGTRDTPILEGVQALDASFGKSGPGDFLLHCRQGDSCAMESFAPYEVSLPPGTEERFGPRAGSGKSSDGPRGWPYFRLQAPGGNLLLAIGWPGQWAGTFRRDEADRLRIIAGQQTTHLTLRPGEEIRTPLIALMFPGVDDPVAAHNLWRRWMLEHNLPRAGGRLPPTMISACPSPLAEQSADNCRAMTEIITAPGSGLDALWIDAGWYPCATGPYAGNDRWLNTGTWTPDPVRLPDGFARFSRQLHAHGKRFILWFEPERVGDARSWLARTHPEWLLPGTSHGSLLNLGHPDARQWLVQHVSGLIQSEGVDWYREDLNGGGPGPAWRRHDAPDRQGLTENLHVQGHLAYWDQLRRRHPGLFIDNCASGGRRNDLETLRRSVPLCRTDFVSNTRTNAIATQSHTLALASWLPYYGAAGFFTEPFITRSYYAPAMTPWDGPAVPGSRQAYLEAGRVAPLMLGDFYPLTPASLADHIWVAWQFDRPDLGAGVVQAFRRPTCREPSRVLRLQGLAPEQIYEVEDLDGGTCRYRGRELGDNGLVVRAEPAPAARVWIYRAVGRRHGEMPPPGPRAAPTRPRTAGR